MVERYCFPYTNSLGAVLELVLTFRKFGYRTFLRVEEVAHFKLLVVHAIPAARPNRKERGCYIKSSKDSGSSTVTPIRFCSIESTSKKLACQDA